MTISDKIHNVDPVPDPEGESECGRTCSCCKFPDGTAPIDHEPDCRIFKSCDCDCYEARQHSR